MSPFLNQYFFCSGTRQAVSRKDATVCRDFLDIDLPQFRGYPFFSRFSSAPGTTLRRISCFSSTFEVIRHRNLRERFSSKKTAYRLGRIDYIRIRLRDPILFPTDQSPRQRFLLGVASYPSGWWPIKSEVGSLDLPSPTKNASVGVQEQ